MWQQQLTQHWPALYMQNFQVESSESGYRLALHVYLDDLSADFVRVEVYADAQDNHPVFRQRMERKAPLPGAVNGYVYEITVPVDRLADDYTPRLVANHCHVYIPAEEAHINGIVETGISCLRTNVHINRRAIMTDTNTQTLIDKGQQILGYLVKTDFIALIRSDFSHQTLWLLDFI